MPLTLLPVDNLNRGVGQTPVTTVVGDTNTEIIPANNNRVLVVLTNIGKNDMSIACDASAVLGRGIFLGRNGGNMVIDSTAFTEGPINGICESGKSSTVTYQEFTR